MGRLRFGVLTFPIHPPSHSPTLQLQDDIDLAVLCDRLGFDEFWFGEHHSGGWQIIGAPELMIAAAAPQTSRIRFGTGVSTLPYHHPLTLLDRIIQLDHLCRGRLIFGVGAGVLPLDAQMIGLDPMQARRMMEESLETMIALLRFDGPVTRKTDWFTLNNGVLQLRPFSEDLDIRVAVLRSPAGPRLAGKYGAGMLSFGASAAVGLGSENPMTTAFQIASEQATVSGQAMDRSRWSVMNPLHIAETAEQARRETRWGLPAYIKHIRQILPMNIPVDLNDTDAVINVLTTVGHGVIGTPEQAIGHIQRMIDISGGSGTFVIEQTGIADPDATRRSYELFARRVMPHFSGALIPRLESDQRGLAADGLTRRTVAAAQAKAGVEYYRERAARRQPLPITDEKVSTHVEVMVLGSGIGGSTAAAILARQGVPVAIVDAARHPRFALGESTIGETSFLMRLLAARYNVPELAQMSTGHGIRSYASDRCGVKTNFGFVYHRPEQEHDPFEVTQCSVSEGPFGPESHLMRADIDGYLYQAAVGYGAIGREGVRVSEIEFDDQRARIVLDSGEEFTADYVIDATGRTSVLASHFGLREQPCRFETDSRTIFTHMRGVLPFDSVEKSSGQPNLWHQGTLHHLFDGGWMWVIPFDNHPDSQSDLVSVGVSYDSARYPKREDVPAEQEWAELLARFPALARQFADATPAFPWISTGRTQFSSSVTVGDRWVLMSHAAGAIDALFSRGMANTMAVIEAFMSVYFKAREDGDFSARRFAYIDTLNQSLLDNNDKLVAGSYIAFRDFDLWRAWSKMWYLAWNLGVIRIAGTYYQYVETGDAAVLDRLHQGELPGTFCPELASSQQQFTDCYQVMRDVAAGQLTPADAVAQLAWILDDGEASPAPLNLQDVLRRWHDGSQETQRMIYQWGRTVAPAALRPFFNYDRDTILATAKQVLSA
ncbi:MAG: LLM class flavin-dependent oxidoreductase [Streptosporangiaceae bacterium]|jgi:FADH2 O2-dependent halogenase